MSETRSATTTAERAATASRLALALDVPSLPEALVLARRLTGHFGVAKVGLELYSAAGPAAIEELQGLGYELFVDLKLHDIPTTVERAAKVLGALGARYVTVHTAGGAEMLAAAVAGLAGGAASAGLEAPCCLGVTVLTSEAEPPPLLLGERAALAAAAGCRGLVCAAPDLPVVTAAAPGLVRVVPGTRTPEAASDDQARIATPAAAIAAGADLLVIGRVVTHAVDPLAATEALELHLGTGA